MSSRPEKPLFAEERKLAIVSFVKTNRSATVIELQEEFDVSPATIRGDLRELEKEGKLQRTHGGAMFPQRTGTETTLKSRAEINVEAKKRIAQLALEQIQDGDTVILDNGTTILELANLLGSRRRIRAITNDLVIGCVTDENQDIDLHILSGKVRPGYHCTIGGATVEQLREFAVDKAFLGTNGFDIERGATTPDVEHAEVKRAMTQAARQNFLLCESEKLGKVTFARFAETKDIDVLITEKIDKDLRTDLERAGVEVLAAETI